MVFCVMEKVSGLKWAEPTQSHIKYWFVPWSFLPFNSTSFHEQSRYLTLMRNIKPRNIQPKLGRQCAGEDNTHQKQTASSLHSSPTPSRPRKHNSSRPVQPLFHCVRWTIYRSLSVQGNLLSIQACGTGLFAMKI